MKRLLLMTALLLGSVNTAALAQATADPHHPSQSATPTPAQPTPPATQPGMDGTQGMMGGMPMMNMMNGMMDMMNNMPMMDMMRMMVGPGMGGMAAIDRVEGRIAFLRAELKITDTQANAWNAFADALRTNAKRLGEARTAMMAPPSAGQQQAPTISGRLDLQEQWLLARLEGLRAMKSVFTSLYATLSDDQKKTADELLAAHMGMGMMAMMPAAMQRGQLGPCPMVPGQMAPGQMGPGQMGPGRMQPGPR